MPETVSELGRILAEYDSAYASISGEYRSASATLQAKRDEDVTKLKAALSERLAACAERLADAAIAFTEDHFFSQIKASASAAPDEREARIVEAFRSADFGCQRSSAAELVEALSGIHNFRDKVDPGHLLHLFRRGLLIVPTLSQHSHNYPIGVPALLSGLDGPAPSTTATALRADGSTGNWMGATLVGYRPATHDEAAAFFVSALAGNPAGVLAVVGAYGV